jgi:FAD/FMN-containing dehydrogenase
VSSSEFLPAKDIVLPATQDELTSIVRNAFETATPLYPIGGSTSLQFGLPAKVSGREIFAGAVL